MMRFEQETNFVSKFLKPMAEHLKSFVSHNGLPQYVKHLGMTVIDLLQEVSQINSIGYCVITNSIDFSTCGIFGQFRSTALSNMD